MCTIQFNFGPSSGRGTALLFSSLSNYFHSGMTMNRSSNYIMNNTFSLSLSLPLLTFFSPTIHNYIENEIALLNPSFSFEKKRRQVSIFLFCLLYFFSGSLYNVSTRDREREREREGTVCATILLRFTAPSNLF